ncbi:MAG: VCBS repeat-containing protein, partial [Ignavibacteriaceae bacterium]|nr:VCBS repeat-containing protein [Ignavibacteriaceae bacterium]
MNKIIHLLFLSLFISTLIYSQQWFSLSTYWEVQIKSGCYNVETADVNRDGHLDIISGNFN